LNKGRGSAVRKQGKGGRITELSEQNQATAAEEDLALVRLCQQGDRDAFNRLITRHRQRAFAMVYHIVRDEQDAWDLAQEGFLKAWKSIGRFRGESAFTTWLHRIMGNVAIDWLRRRRGALVGEFDDAQGMQGVEPGAVTVPRAELGPAERLSDQELRVRMEDALSKLSEEHRLVIVLREMQGLEYQEIAEQMGSSLGTVMSRLFYARKKLQSLLKDVYESL
jgi:RNA polymerase sigma-70 factor (ECF subfamily)